MAGLKSLELASATGGTEARVVTSSAWKDLGKSSNWMVDHPGSYQFMIRCDLKTCWIKVSKKLIFWRSLIVNYPLMVKICVIYIGERSTAVDFLEWRGVLRFFSRAVFCICNYLRNNMISGWWYTYPSEKYDFVSWDDEIPNQNGKS